MSQRITITVTIDVPTGANVVVGGGGHDLEDAPPLPIPVPSRTLADGPGTCPDHHVPFTWKEAGVNKQGVPYDGFYKCGEKNADGSYCRRKPAK